MKNKFFALITLFCCIIAASAESLTVKVTVKNDCDYARKDEPVALQLKDVKRLKFDVRYASVALNGKSLRCQLDDMDEDFTTDEVFWLTDLKAHEAQTFEVTLSDQIPATRVPGDFDLDKAAEADPRIYSVLQIRDKKDLHPNVLKVEAPAESNIFNDIYMHGITIESELVGYRIYFDERQNIDLYGKKLQRLELATTQFYTSAEQLADDYGTDVLWAGKAIGCGSFKRYMDGEPTNWLGTLQKVRGERIVTRGPLRTVVEVYDLGIKNDGSLYNVRQYYSLVAGHRDLKVDVLFEGNAAGQEFCTGVQKVGVTATDSVRMGHTPQGILRADGITASWGCDYPDMGKKQLWGPEAIGMAVYMPAKYVKSSKESDINYLYVVTPNDGAIHYWTSFCCAKENVGYKNARQWFDSMDEWKVLCDNPIKISVK